MTYTQQGLRWLGMGTCLVPFTGGASMVLGGCHLVCGVVYDQLKLGGDRKDPGASGGYRVRTPLFGLNFIGQRSLE